MADAPKGPEFFSEQQGLAADKQPPDKAPDEGLPHVPGLPSIYYARLGNGSAAVLHFNLTDCEHNLDAMPGLSGFLSNLSFAVARAQAVKAAEGEQAELSAVVNVEACPYLLQQLATATAEVGHGSAFVHILKHLFGLVDRIAAGYFADVFEQAGEKDYAAMLRQAITEGRPEYVEKLEATLLALNAVAGCEQTDDIEILLRGMREAPPSEELDREH